MPKYKIEFKHDSEPDFSWLEQVRYNPRSKNYEPIYSDWYRNPENHVTLSMVVYVLDDKDDDWRVIDSLRNIDFLTGGNDWCICTFYRIEDIPASCAYLRELAQNAINKQE